MAERLNTLRALDLPVSLTLSHPALFALAAPKTFNLDIALVKLAEPVELNDMANVACLPDESDVFPPGTDCITAGWGHTVEGEQGGAGAGWGRGGVGGGEGGVGCARDSGRSDVGGRGKVRWGGAGSDRVGWFGIDSFTDTILGPEDILWGQLRPRGPWIQESRARASDSALLTEVWK